MCAERHKSPWMNSKSRMRGYEPEPKRPTHQGPTTKTKQAHLESPGKLQCQWHSASGVRHDACHIGHRAFESCKLLTLVDISGKKSTPCICTRSHNATAWETIKLPPCLREIRAEVFTGCKALPGQHSLHRVWGF